MEAWQKALLAWYRENARPLPWRGEKDPYRVLVSEVLLQQTRVEQAALYYRRFLERFPTLKALAAASLEEVLRVWQGAGYYRRAEHLHRLARSVEELPPSFAELRKLPGLGPYTAAAVASIAFGERVAAVDGNVRRVLSRLFARESPKEKELFALAQGLLPEGVDPGVWNQALMELGATVCLPKRPRCGTCPLGAFCRGKEAPGRYGGVTIGITDHAQEALGEGGAPRRPRPPRAEGGAPGKARGPLPGPLRRPPLSP